MALGICGYSLRILWLADCVGVALFCWVGLGLLLICFGCWLNCLVIVNSIGYLVYCCFLLVGLFCLFRYLLVC